MSDLDHARQMLVIARRDLKALGGMLDVDVFEDPSGVRLALLL